MSKAPGKLIEAEDDSGDWILQFDEDWLKENDWREGDTVDFDMVDGMLTIRNTTKKERNEG